MQKELNYGREENTENFSLAIHLKFPFWVVI